MAFVRVYAGDDGQSHFEDLDLLPPDARESVSRPTTQLIFGRRPDNFTGFHTQKRRQCVIPMVGGHIEVGIGDGTVRQFGVGDAIVFEDMTGQGHTTRFLDGGCMIAIVPVAD